MQYNNNTNIYKKGQIVIKKKIQKINSNKKIKEEKREKKKLKC